MNLTADGLRACSNQHAVEDRYADGRFGLLGALMPCAESSTDTGRYRSAFVWIDALRDEWDDV